jgi:hypothetical protein
MKKRECLEMKLGDKLAFKYYNELQDGQHHLIYAHVKKTLVKEVHQNVRTQLSAYLRAEVPK